RVPVGRSSRSTLHGVRSRWIGAVGGIALGAAVCATASVAAPRASADVGMAAIRHVVVIMQENRSFDHYFGTFPGADGIPMRNGTPTACNPDPTTGRCVAPYHDPNDVDHGGPHTYDA